MASKPPVPYGTTDLIRQKTGAGYRRELYIPGSFDYDVWEDTFRGDEIDTIYPVAKTNGASADVTFTEHNSGGFLEFVTGTALDGYAGQGLGLQYTGDRGVLFETIVKLPSSLATLKFEVGLSDADNDAGAVNVKADPTHTATDYAVFIFDTTENTNFDFMTDGASIAAQETTALRTIVASDVLRLAIRIDGNNVTAYVNGVRVAGHSAAIEGGNTLTPWVFAQARTGSASRTLELHKWRCTQPAWV